MMCRLGEETAQSAIGPKYDSNPRVWTVSSVASSDCLSTATIIDRSYDLVLV